MAETMTITDDRPDDTGTVPPVEDDQSVEISAAVDDISPLVEASEISAALRAVGATSHGLFGHPAAPDHWGFTDGEISALAPPLTSIINRHARLRAIARRSPELAVALTLGRWGIRNTRLTAAIRQAEADLAETEDRADGPTTREDWRPGDSRPVVPPDER